MKELYEVEKLYYVMAENELEAEFIRLRGGEPSVTVSKAKTVDEEWWDAIPFGSDDDKTCGEILTEMKDRKLQQKEAKDGVGESQDSSQ